MPKIVNLGAVKDLRQEWEKVKTAIMAGEVESFYLQLVGRDGKEAVYAGGAYRKNAESVARAALRISIARMRREDRPADDEDTLLDFAPTRH